MNLRVNADCQIKGLAEMYSKYLPDHGTFLEIGAYDGVTHSNSLCLAEVGWGGIYVEPDYYRASKIIESIDKVVHIGYDKNQIVINAAISNYIGIGTLIKQGELSTLKDSVHEFVNTLEFSKDIPIGGTQNTHVMTLDYLLQILTMPKIDLLIIDVEGSELEVLQGFQLLPLITFDLKMIIIELHEKSDEWMSRPGAKETNKEIYKILYQYKPIYKDDINTIFVKKDL